jgi:hypothetical protein
MATEKLKGSLDVWGNYFRNGLPFGGTLKIEYRSLTALEITNKALTLEQTPLNDEIAIDPYGGVAFFPILDFSISGDQVSWDGLGLDGLLEENDLLRLVYIF